MDDARPVFRIAVAQSTGSQDPDARGPWAGNSNWFAFSVPAQYSEVVPSGVVAPDGQWYAQGTQDGRPGVVVADLDPTAPAAEVAVKYRRPWRRRARSGMYTEHLVLDPRSRNKSVL
jgi:predicted amidohydrolase